MNGGFLPFLRWFQAKRAEGNDASLSCALVEGGEPSIVSEQNTQDRVTRK